SKVNRITSIADFIASRYGKSSLLGGLVTVIAMIGVVPYIALQLKAVSTSVTILLQYPDIAVPANPQAIYVARYTAFYVALLLAVGIFVTFGLYHGFGDIFQRAAKLTQFNDLVTLGVGAGTYGSWGALVFLSMLSILFLPRQFQINVVENVNESHVGKPVWLFPLYLFAINIFVLPIAFGGLMHFSGGNVDADTFVLTLPMIAKQEALALFVFIGGLSAATGMVIVETIALSTMICNDLVMPVLLRWKRLALAQRS